MFLHLGGEIVVQTKDIIAILDIESTLQSRDSNDFLKICKEEGFIRKIGKEKPRSFIIVEKTEKTKKKCRVIRKIIIYYSPISAITLQKRSSFIKRK